MLCRGWLWGFNDDDGEILADDGADCVAATYLDVCFIFPKLFTSLQSPIVSRGTHVHKFQAGVDISENPKVEICTLHKRRARPLILRNTLLLSYM